MLVVIGLAAAVAISVWAWGALAGLLFGSGWRPVGAGQVLGILGRLPSRLGNPAAAWPTTVRRDLPGPVAFYGTLMVLAGAGLIVVIAGRVGLLAGRSHGRGARWAAAAELRALRAASPLRLRNRRRSRRGDGLRLSLGAYRGRRLGAEECHAVVAFGPPQSGKSAGLAVPSLLEWTGPAVASSIKTDLLDTTLTRRRALGPVFVFDPFGLAQVPAHTWSPLAASTTWDGALETAWRLASAAGVDHRGVEGGDFWAVAAEQRLAPLLYTAAASRLGMEAVVRWVYGQGGRELDAAIACLTGEAQTPEQVEDAHAAYDAVRAFEAQADRTRSSIEATAQGLLRAYRFKRVLRSASSSEIKPEALLDRPCTLYLIGDAKAAKLLRPLFLALLSEIVDCAYERATRSGGRLVDPLLLCLDEAGNVAPLPNLAEIASTAPSHNIQLVSIFHDLAQARSRYGGQAETVVNSHRARMLLPGVADLDTLRYFADLVGEEETRDTSRTTGAGSEPDPCAAARCWRPRRCASSPSVTPCSSTAACRRQGSPCGCGSPTGGCADWLPDTAGDPRGKVGLGPGPARRGERPRPLRRR
jgi:type IV secretory pathway TraG/TraD family ATPase VirD4